MLFYFAAWEEAEAGNEMELKKTSFSAFISLRNRVRPPTVI